MTNLFGLSLRCRVHPGRFAKIGYSYQRDTYFSPGEDPKDDPDSGPSELCCHDCAYRRHGIRFQELELEN